PRMRADRAERSAAVGWPAARDAAKRRAHPASSDAARPRAPPQADHSPLRYPELIMTTPRLVAFDLDDTLAPSKARIDARIADLLLALLQRVEVAIISGGNEDQFRTQVIAQLADAAASDLSRLHLLPTCGTRYLRHDGAEFTPVYAHDLAAEEKSAALTALREEAERLGLWESEPWGEILEDRGSQI